MHEEMHFITSSVIVVLDFRQKGKIFHFLNSITLKKINPKTINTTLTFYVIFLYRIKHSIVMWSEYLIRELEVTPKFLTDGLLWILKLFNLQVADKQQVNVEFELADSQTERGK